MSVTVFPSQCRFDELPAREGFAMMAWHKLTNPTEVEAEFRKKSRILIDESLGIEVAVYLREKGYNALFVGEVGLAGRSDDDVFAFAWRNRRMVWTHDRDFLDDTRFPEHRNPGIVVLPGAGGNNQAMSIGVNTARSVFGHAPDTWHKTKSVVSPTGEMTIRSRRQGKIETRRYRMTNKGHAEIWED
jgi:predicted nuclease of predicted toxin-antitoxin system